VPSLKTLSGGRFKEGKIGLVCEVIHQLVTNVFEAWDKQVSLGTLDQSKLLGPDYGRILFSSKQSGNSWKGPL
jgi:hypothetical protein